MVVGICDDEKTDIWRGKGMGKSMKICSTPLIIGIVALVTSAAMFVVSGCGRQAVNSQNDVRTDMMLVKEDKTFVSEKKSFQLGGDEYLFAESMEGNDLYCLVQNEVEDYIRHYQLGDGTETQILLSDESDYRAYNFIKTGEGFWCLESGEQGKSRLAFYDGEGVFQKNIEITEVIETTELSYELSDLCEDKDENLYLLIGSRVYLFSKDGNLLGKTTLSGEGRGLDLDENGLVLAAYEEAEQFTGLVRISEKDASVRETICKPELLLYMGNLAGKCVYGFNSDKLYEVDLQNHVTKEILTWNSINILGNGVIDIFITSDSKRALSYDYEKHQILVYEMNEAQGDKQVEKDEIVVATISDLNHKLEQEIVMFNEQSKDVHVTLLKYFQGEYANGEDYQDAVNRFHIDVMTGKCEADLFWVQDDSLTTYAKYGVFEDLSPYLEKSKTVSEEDFLDNVIEAYTIDSKLIGIPTSCFVSTVFARKSHLDGKTSWNTQEMIDYSNQYPDIPFMAWMDGSSLLDNILVDGGGQYVDWDKGTCSFDSEEFRTLLTYLYSQNMYEASYENSLGFMISQGKALTVNTVLSDFDSIQEYRSMFEEDVVAIGYPAEDGKYGSYIVCSGMYTMNSKSAHKESAFDFLEFTLNSDISGGFPTNENKLSDLATRKKGNQDIFEDGVTVFDYGDWAYPIHTVDDTDISIVMDLLDNGSVMMLEDQRWKQVTNIVHEEAAAYFSNQKSIDEVCEVIQNRVTLYVNENK